MLMCAVDRIVQKVVNKRRANWHERSRASLKIPGAATLKVNAHGLRDTATNLMSRSLQLQAQNQQKNRRYFVVLDISLLRSVYLRNTRAGARLCVFVYECVLSHCKIPFRSLLSNF